MSLLNSLSVKRRIEYVKWAREVVEALRGVNPRLEAQFDEATLAASFSKHLSRPRWRIERAFKG
jgi:hypothetical protein